MNPYPAPSASEKEAAARAFNTAIGVEPGAPEGNGTGFAATASAVPGPVATANVPLLSEQRPDAERVEQVRPVERLAEYIRATFKTHAAHRRSSGTDDRLRACKLDAAREYGEREKALIAATGALGLETLYLGYNCSTRVAAVSMLSEIESGGQNKCWTLAPTPWPDMSKSQREAILDGAMLDFQELLGLVAAIARAGNKTPEEVKRMVPPPSHMQQRAFEWTEEVRREELERAQKACERMEAKIDDQLTEGGFDKCRADCLEYLATYGNCVVYGPAMRRRRRVKAVETNGVRRLKADWDTIPEFEAVNPWDCYPAPGAKEIEDGPFVRRVRFSPSELAGFARIDEKSAPAWRRDAIETILRMYPNGGVVETEETDWRNLELDAESGQTVSGSSLIEGLQFFGEVRGSELIATGITKDAKGGELDAETYYEVEALTILDIVVSCRIVESEIGRPLAKASFYPNPESWWSESVLDRVRPAQRMTNASIRAIAVNEAQASGPQVSVDMTRYDCDMTVRPWKVWPKKGRPAGTIPDNEPPLQFFSVPSILGELLQVLAQSKTDRDELSGIPAVAYGQTAGAAAGVTRTASVMSMVTEGATRGMKYVVRQLDRMVRDVVMRCYAFNMLYDKDETIKVGDVLCNPSGVLGFALLEDKYQRFIQFLQMSGNPIDSQIIGSKGRAYLLREIAKRMGLNADKIVPSEEKLEEIQLLNEAKEQVALLQQQANAAATEASIGAEGGGEGGTPPGDETVAPAEETAATPGTGEGTNSMRARQAAARRAAGNGGEGGPGASPAANGTIRQTIQSPQQRAAQGAASAATRAGG